VITIVVLTDHPDLATVIPIGTAPTLGIAGIWWRFVRALDRIGRRSASDRAAATEARVEREQRRVAADARRRWQDAGLVRCRTLLEGLASGSLDPSAAATRAACADEERYLRQVILLDPALFRSGPYLARTLARARTGGVRFAVRTGRVDVESDGVARTLGLLAEGVVARAPIGSEVTVSLFVVAGRLRWSLVGPAVAVDAIVQGWSVPTGWWADAQDLGDRLLVEAIRSTDRERNPAPTCEDAST